VVGALAEDERPDTGRDEDGDTDEWDSGQPLGADVAREDIPDELPVDSAWGDIYDSPYPSASSSDRNGEDYDFQRGVPETLRQRLTSQIELSRLNAVERAIAATIVDSINEDGYLTASLEDLQLALQGDDDEPIGLDEVRMVLRFIQQIDAPGIAARDLSECLHLQLEQLPAETEELTELIAAWRPPIETVSRRSSRTRRRISFATAVALSNSPRCSLTSRNASSRDRGWMMGV